MRHENLAEEGSWIEGCVWERKRVDSTVMSGGIFRASDDAK